MRAFVGVAVAALLLAGCASTSQPTSPSVTSKNLTPATVSAAYIPNLESVGLIAVGVDQGFFKQQKLTVHPVSLATAPLEISAMQSGSVQFLALGPGADLFPMKGLSKYLFAEGVSLVDSVIGNKSDGVTTPASLNGKNVLVPFGTTGELILLETLQEAGLHLSNVHMLNTAPDEQVTGFLGNSAPAVAGWAPITTEILQKDHNAVTIASDSTFYPKTALPLGWGVSSAYAAAHPGVTKRFVTAMLESATYLKSHLSTAAADTAKMTGVPLNLVAQTEHMAVWFSGSQMVKNYLDGDVQKWLVRENQLFIQAGLLPAMVPFGKYNLGQVLKGACSAARGCNG